MRDKSCMQQCLSDRQRVNRQSLRQPESVCDRLPKLIDSNKAAPAEGSKDASRMRKLLIHLKNEPPRDSRRFRCVHTAGALREDALHPVVINTSAHSRLPSFEEASATVKGKNRQDKREDGVIGTMVVLNLQICYYYGCGVPSRRPAPSARFTQRKRRESLRGARSSNE